MSGENLIDQVAVKDTELLDWQETEVISIETLKRAKMVNFRVSAEEWGRLQADAKAHGARSLGDYLRDVVFASQMSGDQVISLALTRITKRLQELQQLKQEAGHEAV